MSHLACFTHLTLSKDFERKASATAIEDDETVVATWFRGFVQVHGVAKTKELLGESYLGGRDAAVLEE